MRGLLALLLVALAGTVQAAPITWVFENVALSDGGSLTGSYVYDAALNQYSGVDITTTAGSQLPGGDYSFALDPSNLDPGANVGFFSAFDSPDQTGLPVIALFLTENMTDAGGTIMLFQFSEGACADAGCAGLDRDAPGRFSLSGQVTAVPIPAAAWLFGSALAGLGWMRRRKGV